MKLKQKIAIEFLRTKFKMLSLVSKRKAAEKAFDLFCTPFMKTGERTPVIFKTAEPLHFVLNGLKINGFRWNQNKPQKVLILHGMGSAAHKFHQYITPLIEKGYEVLAFDAPAHGSSEGNTINAVEYREMIEEVLRLYGPINAFLAHSFGGMALILALEKIPGNEQTKIVLIAPATETKTAVDSAFKMLKLRDPDVRKEFDSIIYDKGGQPTEWYSINRAIQHIKGQTLWIHDEDDDITPLTDALKVKDQNFPNVQFIITKGLGHRKIYGDFSIKKKVLEFL
ncbi:hypothetical protein BH11BAC3_BH11BAC3_25200 [soil metagenome]